jgi:hypothetical protein
MTWKKLGRVFAPTGEHPAMQTHGILPTPHHFGDFVRVYFASCDSEMRGRIFFVDLDAAIRRESGDASAFPRSISANAARSMPTV